MREQNKITAQLRREEEDKKKSAQVKAQKAFDEWDLVKQVRYFFCLSTPPTNTCRNSNSVPKQEASLQWVYTITLAHTERAGGADGEG